MFTKCGFCYFMGECLIDCSFVLDKDTYHASSVKLSKQEL